MPCCGKGKKSEPAIRQIPNPPATNKRDVLPIVPKAIIPKAPTGTFNPPGKFCEKCGWIVAVAKFADPVTGQIIEKRSCTNRKCVDY